MRLRLFIPPRHVKSLALLSLLAGATACATPEDAQTVEESGQRESAAGTCNVLHLQESFHDATMSPLWSVAPANPNDTDPQFGSFLTAGTAALDTAGEGWMRLAAAQVRQRGYAFFDSAFPSTDGVSISFEVATWGGTGADGLVFFLVDGDKVGGGAGQVPFETGAYGGAMGYAQMKTDKVNIGGMPHAVLGVGFDSYGNFSNSNEGKESTKGESLYPNLISLRAGSADNWKYLDESAPLTDLDLSCVVEDCPTRPAELGAGRYRATINIVPNGANSTVTVFTQSDDASPVVQRLEVDIPKAKIADNLKLGFTSSTGGNTNNHEIRSLTVESLADLSMTATASPAGAIVHGDEITYTYVIKNELANSAVCSAAVDLTFPAGFVPTQQTCTVESAASDCADLGTLGITGGTLALGEGEEIVITVTGNLLHNGSTAVSSGRVTPINGQGDQDPTNNFASITTLVNSQGNIEGGGKEVWVVVGTPSVEVTMDSSQPITIEELILHQGVSIADLEVQPGDPTTFILTPDAPEVPGHYEVDVKICATDVPSNCVTPRITIHYNDPPTLTEADGPAVAGVGGLIPLNATYGVKNGYFKTPTVTGNGCSITGSEQSGWEVVYDGSAAAGSSVTCAVRLCEQYPEPAGLCVEGDYTFHVTAGFVPENDTILSADGSTTTTPISTLLSNDGPADALTFELVGTATGGTAVIVGQNVEFTPAPGALTGKYVYKVCSAADANICGEAEVTTNIVQKPTPTDSEVWTKEGTPITVDSPFDVPSDNQIVGTPTGGTAVITTDGKVTFTPDANFVGEAKVTVNGCTQTTPAACADAEITVIVNDLPTLTGKTIEIAPDQSFESTVDASAGQFGAIDPSSLSTTGPCTIVNEKLVYSSHGKTDGDTDSCDVTICEVQPVDTCVTATYVFNVTLDFAAINDDLSTTEDVALNILVGDLTQNDISADEASFTLTGTADQDGVITTEQGGTLVENDTQDGYIYTPAPGFIGDDSFEYQICAAADPLDCASATVTITVNEAPAATDSTEWVLTGTPDVSVDLNDNYVGNPIANVSVKSVGPDDGQGNPPGTVSINGDEITFVPNDPAAAGIYEIVVEICDNATPSACADATITVIYNDPPVTADPAVKVPTDESTTIPFDDLTGNSTQGDVDGGWDPSSIAVSNDPAGPFDTDADLGNENGCAIVDGKLVYTSAAGSEDGDVAPTCYVQVCELNPGPAGTDTTDRACGVIEVTPTIDNTVPPVLPADVDITGPADNSETDDTTPTISGKGEPNTDVTIEIDGKEVGKVPVDADGNWSWTPTEELPAGKYVITASDSNGSTDSITLTITKEDAVGPDLDGVAVSGGRVFGGCSSTGQNAPSAALVALFAGLGLVIRRRRNARS